MINKYSNSYFQEIIGHFRGNELQNYFKKIVEDDLKVVVKPQYVESIPKAAKVLLLQLQLITVNYK